MLRAGPKQHSLSVPNQRKEEKDIHQLLTSSSPPQAKLFVRIDYLPLSFEVPAWLFLRASTSHPKDTLRLLQTRCQQISSTGGDNALS